MPFYFWKRHKPTPKPTPLRSNVGGASLPISVRSEPLVGYRIWRVKLTAGGPRLWAVNTNYEWEVTNTAKCLKIAPHAMWSAPRPPDHTEPAPFIECACGLYAALPEDPIDSWVHTVAGLVHASGSIAMTGRVIRCTMGYKAEHAEIQSPVVLGVDCRSSRACENPVAVVDLQPDYVRGWCSDHAPGAGAVVPAEQFFPSITQQLSEHYGLEVLSWI